jgi:hypothetical protein
MKYLHQRQSDLQNNNKKTHVPCKSVWLTIISLNIVLTILITIFQLLT